MKRLRYALIWLVLLTSTPSALAADSQPVDPRRPLPDGYTLEIRYGRAPAQSAVGSGAVPDARFLNTAKRLDIAVAPRDHGRVATHDATLVYRIDASSQAPAIQLAIELTYSLADGERALQTQVVLTPGRWLALAWTTDTGTDSGDRRSDASAVFVRLDPK
ncbi:hypothetical protein [Salinisphaera aquimarina]|uniref:Uncharacterized protein n=1 Tax=Salinisphaera aquimarina TaxID=2094031 RepID=A0ABV7ETU6_9GAMM